MPTTSLASYLFTRLRQLGVSSIHGVPGDYNLALLDYVPPSGLHWVGNCNELNAGYAADGYARVAGLGALVTTFGVGELSAANAIAGAYAELAAVVHVVGTPARQQAADRLLIHHTFADGRYDVFSKVAAHLTAFQARLDERATAADLIDRALIECLRTSRPVYVEVPTDMVDVPLDAERLKTPIADPRVPVGLSMGDEDKVLMRVRDRVLKRMYAARRPVIFVDGESRAYGIADELHALVTRTSWPAWTSGFGRSTLDESLPNVHGLWAGPKFGGTAAASAYIGGADLVLVFGPHFSGTNTNLYTAIPDRARSVYVRATSIELGAGDGDGADAAPPPYRDVPAKLFLSSLLAQLDETKLSADRVEHVKEMRQAEQGDDSGTDSDGLVTQKGFYSKFGRLLRPGDVVLAETGTPNYGSRDFVLPPATQLFVAVTWLSIGYMLPAAQGAALAQRELHEAGRWPRFRGGATTTNGKDAKHPPRTILLIGDGSFQMTVQELSTIMREKLNVLIVLINNDGYTIERCLHGYKQPYNDVARWRYLNAPAMFGGELERDVKPGEYHYRTARVANWGQLEEVLVEEESRPLDAGPRLSMLEVIMDKEDAPGLLAHLLENTKKAEEGRTLGVD